MIPCIISRVSCQKGPICAWLVGPFWQYTSIYIWFTLCIQSLWVWCKWTRACDCHVLTLYVPRDFICDLEGNYLTTKDACFEICARARVHVFNRFFNGVYSKCVNFTSFCDTSWDPVLRWCSRFTVEQPSETDELINFGYIPHFRKYHIQRNLFHRLPFPFLLDNAPQCSITASTVVMHQAHNRGSRRFGKWSISILLEYQSHWMGVAPHLLSILNSVVGLKYLILIQMSSNGWLSISWVDIITYLALQFD